MAPDKAEERFVDILLVEDNPADVHILREIFDESKISNAPHVVNDGDQAMDFLYRRGQFAGSPRPDLVLLDIRFAQEKRALKSWQKSKATRISRGFRLSC